MTEAELSEQRRAELLEWVGREGATVGHRIPETVTIEDESIELREFVWETKRQGAVPPEYHDEVKRVRTKLRRARDRRKERLEAASLTVAEAEALADTIVGLDRAVVALSNLYESAFASGASSAEIEDHKRWLAFVDQL